MKEKSHKPTFHDKIKSVPHLRLDKIEDLLPSSIF